MLKTFVRLSVSVALVFIAATSAVAQDEGACPDFRSRLVAGERARVRPGTPNNVRSQPSLNADRVGQIPGGGVFDVTGGPVCVDGYTWWQVEYSDVVGWTAEGSADDYWLQPVWMEDVSMPADDQQLPDDVLQGMAMTGFGGGGGGFEGTCIETWEQDLTVPVLYVPDGIGGVDMEGQVYGSGETMVVDALSPIEQGNYRRPELLPAVCASDIIDASEATAISPTGEQEAPAIELIEWETGTASQVQLPLPAYAQPGEWTLQVRDFEITLDVRIPDEPSILADKMLSWEQFIIAGFDPQERVVLLPYYHTDDGSLEVDVVTVEMDEHAAAVVTLPRSAIYITAILGENGFAWSRSIGYPSLSVSNFVISPEDSAQILWDIIWGGETVDLSTWTCPGALPIRLAYDFDAQVRVIAGHAVDVYEEPGDDSTIIGQVQDDALVTLRYSLIQCTPGSTWWQIKYGDEGGWIPESANGVYWLEPYLGQ
jgi:uncharacterized protein YraI